MKKAEIAVKVLGGACLQGGEFLMTKVEVVAYRDKVTQKPAEFVKLGHTVLTADGALVVDEDTRKLPGFSPSTYKSAFTKGQSVVIHVTQKISVRGVVTVSGTLEAVEN